MAPKVAAAKSSTPAASSTYDTRYLQNAIERENSAAIDRFMKHDAIAAALHKLVRDLFETDRNANGLKFVVGVQLESADVKFEYLLGIFPNYVQEPEQYSEDRGDNRVLWRLLRHAVNIMDVARRAGLTVPGMGHRRLPTSVRTQNARETALGVVFTAIVEFACLPQRDRYRGFDIGKIILSWSEQQKAKKMAETELDFLELGAGSSDIPASKTIAELHRKRRVTSTTHPKGSNDGASTAIMSDGDDVRQDAPRKRLMQRKNGVWVHAVKADVADDGGNAVGRNGDRNDGAASAPVERSRQSTVAPDATVPRDDDEVSSAPATAAATSTSPNGITSAGSPALVTPSALANTLPKKRSGLMDRRLPLMAASQPKEIDSAEPKKKKKGLMYQRLPPKTASNSTGNQITDSQPEQKKQKLLGEFTSNIDHPSPGRQMGTTSGANERERDNSKSSHVPPYRKSIANEGNGTGEPIEKTTDGELNGGMLEHHRVSSGELENSAVKVRVIGGGELHADKVNGGKFGGGNVGGGKSDSGKSDGGKSDGGKSDSSKSDDGELHADKLDRGKMNGGKLNDGVKKDGGSRPPMAKGGLNGAQVKAGQEASGRRERVAQPPKATANGETGPADAGFKAGVTDGKTFTSD